MITINLFMNHIRSVNWSREPDDPSAQLCSDLSIFLQSKNKNSKNN